MGGQLFEAEGRLNGFLLDPEKVVIAGEDSILADDRAKQALDEALVLNIMAIGVRKPIVVRKNEKGQPEVVDGRNRLRCCREANKRLKGKGGAPRMIPAIADKGEDDQLFELMVSLNYHIPESPLARAKKLQRYLSLGHTKEQAKVIFCLPSMAAVDNLEALLDAPKKLQHAVESGRISVTAAVNAAKKMTPAQIDKLLADAPSGGKKGKGRVTVAKVQKAVKQAKGGSAAEPPSRKEIEALVDSGRLPPAAHAALHWVLYGERVGVVKELLETMADEVAKAAMKEPAKVPAAEPKAEKKPEIYGEAGMGTVGYDPGTSVG